MFRTERRAIAPIMELQYSSGIALPNPVFKNSRDRMRHQRENDLPGKQPGRAMTSRQSETSWAMTSLGGRRRCWRAKPSLYLQAAPTLFTDNSFEGKY